MPNFRITVDYDIEADTEDEALDKWSEGDYKNHAVWDIKNLDEEKKDG